MPLNPKLYFGSRFRIRSLWANISKGFRKSVEPACMAVRGGSPEGIHLGLCLESTVFFLCVLRPGDRETSRKDSAFTSLRP